MATTRKAQSAARLGLPAGGRHELLGSRIVSDRGASCSWTTTPRVPRHSWLDNPQAVWVQTVEDCVACLAENWDEVHLDHDLGGRTFVDTNEIDCGMEVIRWLCREPRTHLRESLFFVHTHNSVAGLMMVLQMRSSDYKAEFRPFGFERSELFAGNGRAGEHAETARPAGHAVAPVARMAAVGATREKAGHRSPERARVDRLAQERIRQVSGEIVRDSLALYVELRGASCPELGFSPTQSMSGGLALRTVITGGAGFIGSHLCERFLGDGDKVICADNLLTGSRRNIAHLAAHPSFQFLEHNISEPIEIDGPVDNVLHFASPASPVDYLAHPIPTLKVGSLGTHNALGLAKAKGARFLLASTSEVYGDPEVHPQREDYWGNVNPIGPRGCYDEAKRFAEAITMAYHRFHGVKTRIVRIFNTYGPRMRLNDGRALPNFMKQALRGEPLSIYGRGEQTRASAMYRTWSRALSGCSTPTFRNRSIWATRSRSP